MVAVYNHSSIRKNTGVLGAYINFKTMFFLFGYISIITYLFDASQPLYKFIIIVQLNYCVNIP